MDFSGLLVLWLPDEFSHWGLPTRERRKGEQKSGCLLAQLTPCRVAWDWLYSLLKVTASFKVAFPLGLCFQIWVTASSLPPFRCRRDSSAAFSVFGLPNCPS